MEDFVVLCGKVGAEQPEETVTLRWVDTDPSPVNMGYGSPRFISPSSFFPQRTKEH